MAVCDEIQNDTIYEQYSKWHNLWSIFKMATRSNYVIWLAYHKSSIVKKKITQVFENFIWCACNEVKN